MAMTPGERITAILEDHAQDTETEGASQRRSEALTDVLKVCQEAGSDSPDLENIASSLGDGSRSMMWRLPYGESGILEWFLNLLTIDSLKPSVVVHSLRIVGNSCADTMENRERVIQGGHLDVLIRRTQNPEFLPYTVVVLYNILVDYGPAQLAASKAGLSGNLVALIQLPTACSFVVHICNILDILVDQEGEANRANEETVRILFSLATTHPKLMSDAESFCSLATTGAKYLELDSFQKLTASGRDFEILLDTVHYAHTVFNISDVEDPDEFKQTLVNLARAFAHVTAHSSFTPNALAGTSIIDTLVAWLGGNLLALKSAACQALGNLTQSDALATSLISQYNVHEPVVRLVADPAITDANLLHLACGFLKNLAIPAKNKPLLGCVLDPSCVPRVYSMDTRPDVQLSAMSLTRLLLKDCTENVQRICSVWKHDDPSVSEPTTSLQSIVSLFGRTDTEAIKLESARCITNVCRSIHLDQKNDILPDWDPIEPFDGSSNIISNRRERFYSSHDLAKPLGLLITQTKWPSLRADATFVFTLMSRSAEGGRVVLEVLRNNEAMMALTEAVTGSKTGTIETSSTSSQIVPTENPMETGARPVDPSIQNVMTKSAGQNGVALCTELLRNCKGEMSEETQNGLRELIKKGTTIILEDKEKATDL